MSSAEKPKVNRLQTDFVFQNIDIVPVVFLFSNQALSLTTGFVCSLWWRNIKA